MFLIFINSNIMTSIKLKFRPSSVRDCRGSLYYQVIHNGVVKHIVSGLKIHSWEWDGGSVSLMHCISRERAETVENIMSHVKDDILKLSAIVARLESSGIPYTVSEIVSIFKSGGDGSSFCFFTVGLIEKFRENGNVRLSETYASTLNSFMRFRKGRDIPFPEIDSALMEDFEFHLKCRGLSMNTISFYFRILRAIYNRAVTRGLTAQNFPFRSVYTGIARTVKRAITLDSVRLVRELQLPEKHHLSFSRDMFMFSFYTRGMSFIDMAYLRKDDLRDGILSYRRRKTGQHLRVRWEPCMQEIVDRYALESSDYLLPIIKNPLCDDRKQYKNALFKVNRKLKAIGRLAGLSHPLTMYVARHSWATIARDSHVPIPVISEGLGHDSDKTTRIYLASIDNTEIDNANRMILELL